jgi:lipopolysaccharide export system permease protein
MAWLKVLDAYLIRKYLSTFFFSLLICTIITVAIDFSDKVQAFIEKPITIKQILFSYYPGFISFMAALLMPLYTLIAVVFFTSRLAFNAEILSMLNAGVSFRRLLYPYLLAGGVVAVLHFSLNHYLSPWMNKARLDMEHTYIYTDQEKGRTANVRFLVAPDTKVFIRGYNKNNKTASGLRLEKFAGNKMVSILEAENAAWKGEPNRWELNNYTVRNFDGILEQFNRYTTPIDTAINLTPEDFIFFQNETQEMTTTELRAAIDRDRSRGLADTKRYEIEMHRRTADAVTNIILTVIGLAIAGRKVRGGMGLHLAIALGVGALFILLSKFAVSFSGSGTVPPALGTWIPNILFTIVAGWLIVRAQK